MAVIGYATLQVIPSMRGVGNELTTQVTGPLGAAGKSGGQALGAGIVNGLKPAEVAAKKAADTIEKARNKEADAAGKVNVAEAQLQALRDKGVTDVGRLTAAEEKARKAKRDHEAATRTVEAAEKDHAKALEAVEEAANESADAVEDTGKRSLIAADNLVKFGAVAAAGVAAAGAALFSLGSDFADMSNNIRIGTGASGEALDGLVGIAQNLGSQVPATFEDIGSTVADLNTRLGLTGEPLETLSRQFLELNNMGIDTDINGIAASFQAFGITGTDTAAAMDELFQVSQATGLGVNELAAAAVKGGPALRDFGFGLGESAALAGTLDKAGLDTTATFASMQRAMVNFAKDGKSGEQALYGTVLEIENLIEAGNNAAAIDLAGGVFGTRGAAQFVDAVRMGTLSVDDFVSATGATEDTILGLADETRTFSDQWMMFKNDAMAALEPIATRVFGVITDGMGWIKDNAVPAVRDLATWFGNNKQLLGDLGIAFGIATGALTAFVLQQKIAAAGGFLKFVTGIITSTRTWTIAQTALNIVLNANPIGLITIALAALVGGLVIAWRNSETFRNIVKGAWEGIQAAVSYAWENVIQPVFGWFGDRFSEIGDAAVSFYENYIKPTFEFVGSAISTAKDVATTAFDALKSGFGAVGDFFSGVGSTIGGVWDNIVIGIKKAVGSIGRILQKIQIPDWVPGIGGMGTRGLGDSLVQWAAPYRTGGPVVGPGTGTSDSILARLSNGEYVVPEHGVTPESRPLLDALRAGWVPSAELVRALVYGMPGYWAGGPVNADGAVSFAKSKNGLPYVYGGSSGDSWDCSGYMSGIHNALTGENVRYVTGSDFAALGYVRGFDPNGFSIGTNGGVGENGHMAGTLFGTNVESDGSNGVQYGGSADGAQDFPQVWHLPMNGDLPSTQDLGALGAGGAPLPGAGGGTGLGGQSGLGGSWSPGSGGSGASWSGPIPSTGGAAGGSGGTSNTATGGATAEEIAKAVPVKVVNWPGSFGSGAAPAGAATVGTAGDPGAAYGAPVGTAETEGTNLAGDFAKAQADQFLSDLGVSGASGAIPKLFEQIGKLAEEMKNRPAEEHVHYHVSDMDEAVRKHTAQRREEALTWIRR